MQVDNVKLINLPKSNFSNTLPGITIHLNKLCSFLFVLFELCNKF